MMGNLSTRTGTADEVYFAYDYRAFGELVSLVEPADKVTENFTGKEKDDETELDYFGARYLDPMLGMWTSVDPARQFASPYLYAGNGVNPVNGVDEDGNILIMDEVTSKNYMTWLNSGTPEMNAERWKRFNTLNNSPRVYQSKLRETGADNLYIDPDAGPLNGEYSNEQNVGFVNGTMENFFHEILGHAYHDELMALRNDGVGLEKGQTREQFIGFEKDAREIERERALTPKENEDVEKVYGDVFDNTK
ncbi:RHS repeat-associated core domain-containing protein [uncultured Fibrobacter sp.]|uniref:RHS repeat-associated core domain-containing protein n=1 Tax=uncultured Fibrobacter sp. TaxID=261512 RepID=UPI0025D8A05C|nr:RHS repeat-associated core domain-containing protein [uncultured Fibrobacter sp.]